ncbi:MAG: Gfo/Idh/MocA family oxidoreductase [Chloroflexota bacterium]
MTSPGHEVRRVGVVGAGFMGGTHAAAWASLGVPVTVFAPDAAHARVAAEPAGADIATSLGQLLATVDLVDICTPTDTHPAVARAAAAAGRHVLVEKPLALDADAAAGIVEACHAAGVRLFVAHVLRYVPEYAAARSAVMAGEIGDPAVLRLKRAAFRPQKPAGHWLFDPARSGGMAFDLLIHDIDFARWVAGDVARVFAWSAGIERPDRPLDHAFLTLTHASGAITQITGSWAYGPPTFRTAMEIAGSRGLIAYDSERAQPLLPFLHARPDSGQGAVGISRSLALDDPFTEQLRDVLRAIRDGGETRVTAHDATEAVRIGAAVNASARTGRAVDVVVPAPAAGGAA